MLRFIRVGVTALALALLVPAVARAVPIEFEFTGVVIDPGYTSPGVNIGDEFRARLFYVTEQPFVSQDADFTYYGFPWSFELHVGTLSWLFSQPLWVSNEGSGIGGGNSVDGTAGFVLSGRDFLPPGGGLPTTLDLASAAVREVYGYGPDDAFPLIGQITSIVRLQGPDPVPTTVPEPATLTLSALGLAALAARRRARA